MNAEKIGKSTQEQAVGAWINYLNQVRLDRLDDALKEQDGNFDAAMKTIETAVASIREDVIARNRGGGMGMHGFIAEIAECGIGNARQQIVGKAAEYVWVNDNGPVDLWRGADAIQVKFSQAGGHLSLRAVAQHLHHYPEFLTEGGKYQVPKDHYDKIMAYLAMPEDTANKLPTSTGEFSLRQWREVHTFFEVNDIDVSKLEPSLLEYSEVQKGTIAATIDREKEHIEEADRARRYAADQESKPNLAEGAKAAAVGAAAEGAAAFISAIARKRKDGKRLKDFDEADWMDVAGDSAKGAGKGGVRGVSIYLLTNYTVTSAAAASALTTAAFGVAQQAHLFRSGRINELQFVENSELLCLDAVVSGVASFAGQVLIPVPILGAVIGNAVGMTIYQIGKDSFTAKELERVEKYLREFAELDEKLAEEYQLFIEQMNHCYAEYMELLADTFAPDIERALDGSVALAKRMGVPGEEILDNYDKITSYFMD